MMTRHFLKDFVDRQRAKAVNRRDRALHKAATEMKLRENREASIWRTGKGGGHFDR